MIEAANVPWFHCDVSEPPTSSLVIEDIVAGDPTPPFPQKPDGLVFLDVGKNKRALIPQGIPRLNIRAVIYWSGGKGNAVIHVSSTDCPQGAVAITEKEVLPQKPGGDLGGCWIEVTQQDSLKQPVPPPGTKIATATPSKSVDAKPAPLMHGSPDTMTPVRPEGLDGWLMDMAPFVQTIARTGTALNHLLFEQEWWVGLVIVAVGSVGLLGLRKTLREEKTGEASSDTMKSPASFAVEAEDEKEQRIFNNIWSWLRGIDNTLNVDTGETTLRADPDDVRAVVRVNGIDGVVEVIDSATPEEEGLTKVRLTPQVTRTVQAQAALKETRQNSIQVALEKSRQAVREMEERKQHADGQTNADFFAQALSGIPDVAGHILGNALDQVDRTLAKWFAPEIANRALSGELHPRDPKRKEGNQDEE